MSSGGGGSSAASSSINKISTGAAKQAQGLNANLPGQNLGQQYLPQFQQGAQDLSNLTSNYANQVVGGADMGAQIGGNIANRAGNFAYGMIPYAQQLQGYGQSLLPQGTELFNQGQQLFGKQQPLYDEGNKIAEMGFDPQSALYNRTLQQTQEQQRAAQSARGIASSPYGAGLEADATKNFNIDWQNQQLARAAQAGQAQAGLYGQAGNLASQAGNLYQQGGGLYGQAADIGQTAAGIGSSAFNLGSGASDLAASAARQPYLAQQGLTQDRINALAGVAPNVASANQPRQQVIGNYMQAAGLGPSYSNAASGAQQAGTNQMTGLASIPLHLMGK